MAVGQNRGSYPGDVEPSTAEGKHRRPAAQSVDSLLRHVARGDAEAFASLCEQVDGAVYGVVSRITREPARAEQVTENVLLEVWRCASQFSPAEGSGLNWIMTMARRRALSEPGADATAAPAEVAVKQATLSLSAHHGIASLPESQREAVLMASRGYTWHQVAERAGAPASTAAGWLRDGLLRLSSRPEKPGTEADRGI